MHTMLENQSTSYHNCNVYTPRQKIGVGDFGLPMLHEERVLEGKQGCDTGEEEKAENH